MNELRLRQNEGELSGFPMISCVGDGGSILSLTSLARVVVWMNDCLANRPFCAVRSLPTSPAAFPHSVLGHLLALTSPRSSSLTRPVTLGSIPARTRRPRTAGVAAYSSSSPRASTSRRAHPQHPPLPPGNLPGCSATAREPPARRYCLCIAQVDASSRVDLMGEGGRRLRGLRAQRRDAAGSRRRGGRSRGQCGRAGVCETGRQSAGQGVLDVCIRVRKMLVDLLVVRGPVRLGSWRGRGRGVVRRPPALAHELLQTLR